MPQYLGTIMTRSRRALGAVAIAWLVCQTAALVAAPPLLIASASADLNTCTCGHGADATCPMHHKKGASSNICVIRALTMRDVAVLQSIVGVAGLLPADATTIATQPAARPLRGDDDAAAVRPTPPEPPPPRA